MRTPIRRRAHAENGLIDLRDDLPGLDVPEELVADLHDRKVFRVLRQKKIRREALLHQSLSERDE